MLLGAAPGQAANLIVLDGEDPVTLSGTRQYDIVYLDTDVRLDGDLNLRAASVYIGPNATIQSCFAAPNDANGCGAVARSMTITADTSLSIANPISLRPAETAAGNGGTLTLVGKTVLLGDAVDVSGRNGGLSGSVTIQAQERLDVQGVSARGGAITLVGPDGVRAGEVRADAPDNSLPPHGGAVTLTSARGDVVVRGLVSSRGRGAGGPFGGGTAGAMTLTAGGAVRVGALSVAGGDADLSDGTPGGTLVVNAGTVIHVQGAIEAWGGTTEGGGGGQGGVVQFTAKGAVTVANVTADGGAGGAGARGGSVSIKGAEISAGNILARGSNSAAAAGSGAARRPRRHDRAHRGRRRRGRRPARLRRQRGVPGRQRRRPRRRRHDRRADGRRRRHRGPRRRVERHGAGCGGTGRRGRRTSRRSDARD